MAAQSFSQLLARYQLRLRDTAQTTFTLAEQTDLLTSAFNDRFVTIYDRDVMTSVFGQAIYPYTGAVTSPTELLLDVQSNGYGYPIDSSAWDYINGNFIFGVDYQPMLGGLNIYIWGKRKLATTDLVPDALQEYLLEVGYMEALKLLKMTLATRFLKNDMTMPQINQAIGECKQTIQDMRRDQTNTRPQRW